MKKSPFEVPHVVRLKYCLSANRWVLWSVRQVPLLILFAALFLLLAQLPVFIQLFKDPSIAALFGAVVGALLAGVLSRDIQLEQFQAGAAIAKKKTIYEPIYSELLKLKRSIERHPYPGFFRVDPDRAKTVGCLSFVEWIQAKRDSRHLQVPRWIASALDGYVAELNEYTNHRREANYALQRKIAQIFKANTEQAHHIIAGTEEIMLVAVVLKKEDDFWRCFPTDKGIIAIRGDKSCKIWTTVVAEYQTVDQVRQWLEFYEQSVMGHMVWLIQELGKVIKYIDVRFEAQGDIF